MKTYKFCLGKKTYFVKASNYNEAFIKLMNKFLKEKNKSALLNLISQF